MFFYIVIIEVLKLLVSIKSIHFFELHIVFYLFWHTYLWLYKKVTRWNKMYLKIYKSKWLRSAGKAV